MFHRTDGQLFTRNRRLFAVSSGKEVPLQGVITADGWNVTRKLITANGTMPGPDIIVHQNQKITIIVHNHLLSEGITIHWHGIEQFGTPAMDGTPFVTQCPILPGQSFNYTFTPRIGGSYFYHSHSGVQFDMGLFGAFIVLRHRDPIPFERQIILQLYEWNHHIDSEVMFKSKTIPHIEYHSVLINGKGEFQNNTAPLQTFYVDKSERYLFRLIAASLNEYFLFFIPGIRFTVIETDGNEVVPLTVDKILIFNGERFDIELELTNVTEGRYEIFVDMVDGSNLAIKETGSPGHAFLYVTNKMSLPTVSNDSSTDASTLVLNCAFNEYYKKPNWTCLPLSTLNTANHIEQIHITEKRNKRSSYFLNLSFRAFPTLIGASINGRIFVNPSVSSLSQPTEVSTSCPGCNSTNQCFCSYSLDLETGTEVVFIFLNLDDLNTHYIHPMHIHGHKFQILKESKTTIDASGHVTPTTDVICDENPCRNIFKWTNESWNDYRNIPGINIENGVYKDTVAVPAGGYVIARIWATNPGVWLLHCHRSLHLAIGMAVMLNESYENVQVPSDLPLCRSFLNKEPESLPLQTTSNVPWDSATDISSKAVTTDKIQADTSVSSEKESSMFGKSEQN